MSELNTLFGPAANIATTMDRAPYIQPFDNTVPDVLIDTIPGWSWATADGGVSNNSTRQVAKLSHQNGVGGTPGFAFNTTGPSEVRGNVAWYSGHPTPLRLSQAEIAGLELDIGHSNTTAMTRFLICIETPAGNRWFVTRERWSSPVAVANAEQFPESSIWIETQFENLTWRPFRRGTVEFDGLNGATSEGFTIIADAPEPAPVALPDGLVTAIGVYHVNTGNMTTRFDNFRIEFRHVNLLPPSKELADLLPTAHTLPTGPVNVMAPTVAAITLPNSPVNLMAPQTVFTVPSRPSLPLNSLFTATHHQAGGSEYIPPPPPIVPIPTQP